MTGQEVRAELSKGLTRIYGIQEGLSMAGRVVPGIMNDFTRMLYNCQTGEGVQEEYRFEDGRARVFLSGRRLDETTVTYEYVKVTEA